MTPGQRLAQLRAADLAGEPIDVLPFRGPAATPGAAKAAGRNLLDFALMDARDLL